MLDLKNSDNLFAPFLQEKQFLDGMSPATIRLYSKAWLAFKKHGKGEITEAGMKDFMVEMVSSRLKPSSANGCARSFNSFLTWLYETGHTEKHLKVPLQNLEKKVLKTYGAEEVSKIVSYRPEKREEKRIQALRLFLIDTGARINEALTLTRKSIDFNNLLVTLKGKGAKERRVPNRQVSVIIQLKM
jgi:integrase/recombinase XerD